MNLVIYPLLNTCSKRAIKRRKKKWGHWYQYEPRAILVQRLCAELGWSEEQVREQIRKEREFLLENKQYYG